MQDKLKLEGLKVGERADLTDGISGGEDAKLDLSCFSGN